MNAVTYPIQIRKISEFSREKCQIIQCHTNFKDYYYQFRLKKYLEISEIGPEFRFLRIFPTETIIHHSFEIILIITAVERA